jgi:Leucine-rich repeat (LRR) protein
MRLGVLFSIALFGGSFPAGAAESLRWIEDAGGSVTSDAQGRIVAVDLRASWVTDSDLASLAKLSNLRRLDLSQTRITDHGLRQLKNAPAIEELDLRYAESITGEGISALKNWKHLKKLDLEGTKITDDTLQHLSGLSSLEALNIGYALVTDAGIEALTGLTNLKELTLGGNKLTDAGLQPLRQMPGLTYLDLGGAQREDSGLWSLSLTQPGLESIATLTNLTRLRLTGILVGARALAILQGLPRMEALDLHNCARVGDDSIVILAGMPALRWVDLTGTQVTAEGVEQLRRAKPECKILLGASSVREHGEDSER